MEAAFITQEEVLIEVICPYEGSFYLFLLDFGPRLLTLSKGPLLITRLLSHASL